MGIGWAIGSFSLARSYIFMLSCYRLPERKIIVRHVQNDGYEYMLMSFPLNLTFNF